MGLEHPAIKSEPEKDSFFSFFSEFRDNNRTPYSRESIAPFIQKLQELSEKKLIRSRVVYKEISQFLSEASHYPAEKNLSASQQQAVENLCVLIEVALATNQ